MTYIIYPSGATIYGKASLTADPWESDAVALTDLGDDLYEGDTDNPLLYVQAGGTPASTDTPIGNITDLYYGSEQGGNIWLATRMHAWDWKQSTVADRVRALYHATYLIDKFNFIGQKIEDTQNLQFPREEVCVTASSTTTTPLEGGAVPASIEEAAYLIADKMLSGRDPDADFESLATKVETFGPVRTEYERGKGPQEHMANLIPSPDAWQRIKPFLKISTAFEVRKG